ncbi:MAG TPA: amino acid ABC transporter ATP-binding protein [Acidimicrobiia bacterium]|nr:ABC-type transporter, ATPase subunit [Acidimicrobiia bacterium]HYJ25286.1 amino acid ABC transporter ATP-binding protein [Acidimicrobiia bacterium]
MSALLDVRGVWKQFGDLIVLADVSLALSTHEVLAVVGPSGSGKSTLLRCINLLEPVDDGEILLEGVDIADPEFDADDARRRIGIVFQSFNLFPHLSVLDNITLAPNKVLKISKEEAQVTAQHLLNRFDLADKRDEYPDRLSGGQQQRVAIIRALAMNPSLMLFDEPTSALDPELVGEVLGAIKTLAAEGMTMIVVSHELAFARDVADRVVFMDEGRVVEEGPPDQVLVNPTTDRARRFLRLMAEVT